MARRAPVSLGTIRLWTGLVLFAFVLCHLLNHALGIISVSAQNAGTKVLLGPWTNPLGGTVLALAALLHIGANLYTLWKRRTLRLKPWEAIQYVSGLLIPVLIIDHVVANRVMVEAYHTNTDYYFVQAYFWLSEPVLGVKQAIALVIAWTHGSIGIWHWLKMKRWFPRAQAMLLAVAVVIPALSLAGFIAGSREILREAARDPEYLEFLFADTNWTPENLHRVTMFYVYGLAIYGALLGAVAVGWGVRRARTGLTSARVTYDDKRAIVLLPGATLLETLRANGVQHPSVCGGRGRCTTCRVLVREGAEALAPPEAIELGALKRIEAPENVRLACQIRPTAALSIVPLLSPNATPADGRRPGELLGREQLVTVLFVDLRGSTGLGEARLPFDTLFILNQFFAEMIQALRETNGHYANFTGDGLMAIYGLRGTPQEGCRQAIVGAGRMLERLGMLNERLENDLEKPLRMGIGIHTGDAIVGEMGPPDARLVSAIGDTVNLAARLEGLSKELGKPIVISGDTLARGEITLPGVVPVERTVRGRQQPIAVYAIETVPEDL
jgi:adenylate cyclase